MGREVGTATGGGGNILFHFTGGCPGFACGYCGLNSHKEKNCQHNPDSRVYRARALQALRQQPQPRPSALAVYGLPTLAAKAPNSAAYMPAPPAYVAS